MKSSKNKAWNTLDRLVLISSVLVNGDQNWSVVSEQINNYYIEQDDKAKPDFSIADCKKEYGILTKTYGDPKKVYTELANQRLTDLDDLLKANLNEYDDLYKEIELILSGDMDDQLINASKNIDKNSKIDMVNECELSIVNDKMSDKDRQSTNPCQNTTADELMDTSISKNKDNLEIVEIKNEPEVLIETVKQSTKTHTNDMEKSDSEDDTPTENKTVDSDEYLSWRPDINTQESQLNEDDDDDDDDDDGTKLGLKKLNESRLDSIRMKSLVTSDFNKETSSNSSTTSSTGGSDKRSCIDWKPVIDNNDKPVGKVEKLVKLPSKQDLHKDSKTSKIGNLRQSLSVSSTSLLLDSNHSALHPSSSTEELFTDKQLSTANLNDETPRKLKEREQTIRTKTPETSFKQETRVELNTSHDKQKTLLNANNELYDDESSQQHEIISVKKEFLAEKHDETVVQVKVPSAVKPVDKDLTRKTYSNTELIFTPKIKDDDDDQVQLAKAGNKSKPDVTATESSQLNKSSRSSRRTRTIELSVRTRTSSGARTRSESQFDHSKEEKVEVENKSSSDKSDADTQLTNVVSTLVVEHNEKLADVNDAVLVGEHAANNEEPNKKERKPIDDLENQDSADSSLNSTQKIDDEKTHRGWKKSVLMVLNNITCHKHATIFNHAVKDEIAPGYSNVVYRPMDLSTIKRNIENSTIKTTKEFQRDIMLMFINAIMYNSSNHDVHKIALEMYKEVIHNVELLNTQESMNDSKPSRFKESRASTTSDRDAFEADTDVANLLKKESALRSLDFTNIKSEDFETASNSNSSISNATSTTQNKRRRVSTVNAPQTMQLVVTPTQSDQAAKPVKRRKR